MTELVDPAIGTLARLMVMGSSDAIKLRAAEALLDRAGHPRASRVEATVNHVDAREMLIDKLRALRAQRGELEPAHPMETADVIEAEVVEEVPSVVETLRAALERRAAASMQATTKPAMEAEPEEHDAEPDGDEHADVGIEGAAKPPTRSKPLSAAARSIARSGVVGTPGGAVLRGANDPLRR